MKNKPLILKILLWPFSVVYGIVVHVRNWLFDRGIIPSKKFDVPVVSVGNITVGGTGKTPFTEYLVNLLKDQNQIAILSRGYKRQTSGYRLLTAKDTPLTVGDEPYQMKRKFPDVTVAVDADRRRGIKNLLNLEEGKPDIVILDDAFQHRYVHPKVSILLIDYNRNITEDHLLPVGMMREPKRSMKRADIIVVTKCPDSITPMDMRLIRKHLNPYPYQSLWFTKLCYGNLKPLFPSKRMSNSLPLSDMSDCGVLALTGIASPAPFVEYLQKNVSEVASCLFGDHHNYTASDMKRIREAYEEIAAKRKYIVTTEKDAVRLMNNPDFPDDMKSKIFYLPLTMEFLREEENHFNENLTDLIRRK